MMRLITALLLLLAPVAALAGPQKPIVLKSGQLQGLGTADTLQLPAPTTASASINLPHGTAPTVPNNGDIWTTTGGLWANINGASSSLTADVGAYTYSISGSITSANTYPYGDLNVKSTSYGTTGAPLTPNVGNGNYFTPQFNQVYVGAGHVGGVQGAVDLMQIRGAQSSNLNRNYVARQFFASATTPDNGTGTTMATGKGQLFGFGTLAVLYNGATNWLNLSGGEVNVQASTGSSVADKSGLAIVQMPQDAVAGSAYDGALQFSNQGGSVGWKNLILISAANGQNPLQASGCILCVADNPTYASGINLNGSTITGNAYTSPGFSVDGSGNVYPLNVISSNSGAVMRLGKSSTASTVAVQFLSSGATATTYDSSISGYGGGGTQGQGGLSFDASIMQPANDNYTSLGAAAHGFASVRLSPVATASLGTCNAGAEGTLRAVNDANAATFNTTVAGGGANHVLAFCNGSGWVIH